MNFRQSLCFSNRMAAGWFTWQDLSWGFSYTCILRTSLRKQKGWTETNCLSSVMEKWGPKLFSSEKTPTQNVPNLAMKQPSPSNRITYPFRVGDSGVACCHWCDVCLSRTDAQCLWQSLSFDSCRFWKGFFHEKVGQSLRSFCLERTWQHIFSKDIFRCVMLPKAFLSFFSDVHKPFRMCRFSFRGKKTRFGFQIQPARASAPWWSLENLWKPAKARSNYRGSLNAKYIITLPFN